MTYELVFVQGDTDPDYTAVLFERDSPTSVIDLSTAEGIRFQMRRDTDKRFTVDAAASVTDAVNGVVSYSWGPNDLAVPGDYVAQWEIHWLGGRTQTTAFTVPLTIRRR